MTSHPPPLCDPAILPTYADAQAALARIEERLRLSPVRGPWKARMALAERQALAAIDAYELPDEAVTIDARGRVVTGTYDLTHWKYAIGRSITLDALMADPAALLAWLGTDREPLEEHVPGRREVWELVPAIDAWSKACQALPPSPPLVHAGRIALLWRQLAPLARGDAIASLLIGDRWGPGRWKGSHGGLTALGLKLAGGRWKIAQGAELDHLWLGAILAGANAHLELELRLRGYAQRAAGHIRDRRRPGRLKELILFAMARPAVTSSQVAKHLDLTSAGAIKLLSTAEAEGLLIEWTGQASFRSYIVPVGGAAPSPLGRRVSAADPFEPTFWDELGDNAFLSEPR
ncbi:hypothetical protein [Sphingobium sp. R-21]|uniref:hypothetical protein n=1 Tax=Sphingobium sp. R-21 TaxID=3404056 RepID=UPI003CED3C43